MTKQPEQTRVAICIPSGRSMEADMAMSLAGLASYSSLKGIALGIMNHKGSMITAARNNLVKSILGWPKKPHFVFFMDADMIVRPDIIERLIAHDKDIVCATYNRRAHPYTTLGHLVGPYKDVSGGGLYEADLMPGGLMLIKTEVFEKLSYPWFFETYYWDHENPTTSFVKMLNDWSVTDMPLEARTAILANPAISKWLADNREALNLVDGYSAGTISEDYNFCRKVRKAGYQIWCDMDVTFQVGHVGEQVVTSARPPKEADRAAAA